MCDLIVERAEGNPFFVEKLIGTLIDRGVLERRNGGWTVNELPEEFRIPDTVHAVVAARMDLLPAAEKAALQAAAVAGRVFWRGRWWNCSTAPSQTSSCSEPRLHPPALPLDAGG